jgi:hypothetical protein
LQQLLLPLAAAGAHSSSCALTVHVHALSVAYAKLKTASGYEHKKKMDEYRIAASVSGLLADRLRNVVQCAVTRRESSVPLVANAHQAQAACIPVV